MNDSRVREMEARLRAALAPETLEITDQSHLHAGHPGARGGGGHYALRVVSDRFADQSTVERHRMIYAALGDMMGREIHALSIQAYTPDEL